MANIFDTTFSIVDEVTWGTAVGATRGVEILSESLKGEYERIDSEGLRATNRVQRIDRFVVNPKGASGDVEFEVEDTQFGIFLKHALGGSSVGALALGVTPITFTVGALDAKGFTCQVNRPDSAGTDNVFTYEGGKITEWELSNAVDETLKFKASMDFELETTPAGASAYAKQTVVYPAVTRLLTFAGGTVLLDAAAANVTDISIKGSNNLKTDRYFFTSGKTKKEQLESGMREYSFDMTLEFHSTAMLNKYKSSTRAGSLAALSATWLGPDTVAATGQPGLVVTAPQIRIDDWSAPIGGSGLLEQKVSGKILWDGTASPITAVYTTADTAP